MLVKIYFQFLVFIFLKKIKNKKYIYNIKLLLIIDIKPFKLLYFDSH